VRKESTDRSVWKKTSRVKQYGVAGVADGVKARRGRTRCKAAEIIWWQTGAGWPAMIRTRVSGAQPRGRSRGVRAARGAASRHRRLGRDSDDVTDTFEVGELYRIYKGTEEPSGGPCWRGRLSAGSAARGVGAGVTAKQITPAIGSLCVPLIYSDKPACAVA